MNEVVYSCSFQVCLLPVQKHFHHFSHSSRRRKFRFGVYFIYFLFLVTLFHFLHFFCIIIILPFIVILTRIDKNSVKKKKKNRQSTNGISLKRYMTMNNFIIYIAFNVAKNGTNEIFDIELATITIRKHFLASIYFVHEGHKFG